MFNRLATKKNPIYQQQHRSFIFSLRLQGGGDKIRRDNFCGFEHFPPRPNPYSARRIDDQVLLVTMFLDKQQSSKLSKLQHIHIVTSSISGKLIIVSSFQKLHKFL